MKKFTYLIGLLLFLLSSWTLIGWEQSSSPYLFSSQIVDAFEKDTTTDRSKNSMASNAFSYIGEYQQALAYHERDNKNHWLLMTSDSLAFLAFKPINAQQYILNRAKNEQIIILNEAHHNSLHRVFTASLLKELYQIGFRYLAAETLGYQDSTLNQRKYPVLQSGYYSKEPQYGNLLREALLLGYQLVPYEASTPEEFASGKNREIAQARNIEKVLKKAPKARILIHCGYDHVIESPLTHSWEKAMAGRLKEFTGIDPFTIDQQKWTETSEPANDNPLYRKINIHEASVFINPKGEVFPTGASSLATTDIRVAHPRTTYQYGRPGWLLRNGQWKPLFLKTKSLPQEYPLLVLAYQKNEKVDNAIPVDVIELKNQKEVKALILPTGNYRIIVKSLDGKTKEMTIKHG